FAVIFVPRKARQMTFRGHQNEFRSSNGTLNLEAAGNKSPRQGYVDIPRRLDFEKEDKMNRLSSTRICLAIAIALYLCMGSSKPATAQVDNTQTSELYKLQAAYHRAATVRDPVNGDSPATITGRLRGVLSLFSVDAVLYLHVGSAVDGYYIGN